MRGFLKGIALSSLILAPTVLASGTEDKLDTGPLEKCVYRFHVEDTFLLAERKKQPKDDTLVITEVDVTALAVAKKGNSTYFLAAKISVTPMSHDYLRREAETTGLALAVRGDKLPYTIENVPITYVKTDLTLHNGHTSITDVKVIKQEGKLALLEAKTKNVVQLCPSFETHTGLDVLYSYRHDQVTRGLYRHDLSLHDKKQRGMHSVEFGDTGSEDGSMYFVIQENKAVPIGIMVDAVIVDGKPEKTYADAGYIQRFLNKVLK